MGALGGCGVCMGGKGEWGSGWTLSSWQEAQLPSPRQHLARSSIAFSQAAPGKKFNCLLPLSILQE
eukprot:10117859-Prorocentrum_lima.AAC.1